MFYSSLIIHNVLQIAFLYFINDRFNPSRLCIASFTNQLFRNCQRFTRSFRQCTQMMNQTIQICPHALTHQLFRHVLMVSECVSRRVIKTHTFCFPINVSLTLVNTWIHYFGQLQSPLPSIRREPIQREHYLQPYKAFID